MRTLHVNGYGMAYAEHGTGAPLLLVHGSLLDQRYWAPQMGPLGEDFRVVAPSLRPGVGGVRRAGGSPPTPCHAPAPPRR